MLRTGIDPDDPSIGRVQPSPGRSASGRWFSGPGLLAKKWLHADHLGSIVAWTNASGGSPTINKYDEYGVPAATNTGRFQYTGQAWIPELGLYYYKARMYSPGLGRFMQTDPVGYESQMNLYAYVGGDPVNRADPRGNDSLWVNGPDGSVTLIIPVQFVGPGAIPQNVNAILTIANSLQINDSNMQVQVIQSNEPASGILNQMTLSPGYDYDNYPMAGEGQLAGPGPDGTGGRQAYINTDNIDFAAAAAHDILHFAGIIDRYVELEKDAQGNRRTEPVPGYTPQNIMSDRTGRELKPEQVNEARTNPTTKQCEIEIGSRIPVCR